LGLYGHTLANAFGPRTLKALREKMIAAGWCRKLVNQRVGRVRRVIRWAASEQLVPVALYQALALLLRSDRTNSSLVVDDLNFCDLSVLDD
jgi:hypothetical protein